MYALDTNTLFYYFKGQGRIAERLLALRPAEIGIPVIALYELETGIAKSQQPQKRRKQLDTLLTVTKLLPFDRAAARRAAELRAGLEAAGTPMGPLDSLIAGIALEQRAILVTHNLKEFRRVPGLKLEDWY
ncbi:MAG: type II toxin-antitoxin system VapC family toxin [Betaproteobacteria bacterium]|nr:type II toxin-antitoxin system VapC family toxin [Betaproteobacteria bacterium]